jgi:hypothetical protein
MPEFLWIDWNQQKIDNHNLSVGEVEFAWHRRVDVKKRTHATQGQYFESLGECPSGRIIRIVWRYNQEGDRKPVFVITAY